METLIIGCTGSGKSSYLNFIAKDIFKNEDLTAVIITERGRLIEDVLPERTRTIHIEYGMIDEGNANKIIIEKGEILHIALDHIDTRNKALWTPFFESIEKGIYEFNKKSGCDVTVIIDAPSFYKYIWGITRAECTSTLVCTIQTVEQLPLIEKQFFDESWTDIFVTSITDLETAEKLSELTDNKYSGDKLLRLSQRKLLLFQNGQMFMFDKGLAWNELKELNGQRGEN